MAKKTVATLQTGKEGRSYTKVIKMVKSPKKWQQKTPDFRGGKLARQEQPLLYRIT